MAIQDADAERRNLVVTSLAFLIFYLADGKVSGSSIALQVVPVTFGNTLALVVFVWAMLLWFALRYWQTHRAHYSQALRTYCGTFNSETKASTRYLIDGEGLLPFHKEDGTYQNGFKSDSLSWEGSQLCVKYELVHEFEALPNRGVRIIRHAPAPILPLKGSCGIKIRMRYFLLFAIDTPGFTSFAVPYLLFFSVLVVAAMKQYGFLY